MVKKGLQASALVVANVLLLSACGGGGSSTDTVDSVSIVDDSSGTDDNSGTCDNPVTSLPTIFLEFNTSPNVTAVLSSDGCYVTVEANGKPNHTSSYWDSGNESGLYVEPEDPELFDQQRSPGDIEDYIYRYICHPVEYVKACNVSYFF